MKVSEYCLPCRFNAGGSRLAANLVRQTKLDARPPVSVKGTKHGLLFLLDEQCEHLAIVDCLKEMLQGDTSGLFAGPEVSIFVDYGTRNLSKEENRELFALFMERDNFVIREFAPKTSARAALFTRAQTGISQAVYRGTVRAGQSLTFEGDVVILGDVNPGGQVSAIGDIYVFGRLQGIAHAGIAGNHCAVVAAAEFAPLQLRIADLVGQTPQDNGKPLRTFMEFAYVRNGLMAVDRMQFLSSYQQAQT